MKQPSTPPMAKLIEKKLVSHQDVRIDPYYWLRDKENPETLAYIQAENDYFETYRESQKELEDQLFSEIKGRIKEDDQSAPYKKNQYWYYVRYEEGQEHPIYCRKKEDLKNREEVILNVNDLAQGKAYCQVGGISVSPDNRYLAFGLDELGRRIYQINFMDLQTGKLLDLKIENTTGSCTWSAEGEQLFFTRKDESLRPYQIIRRSFDHRDKQEELVFEEEDPTFNCTVYKSKSERFILIASHSTLSTEYRYLDATNPKGQFSLFQKRTPNLEYSVAHYNEHWYIRTNLNGAQNFQLMRCPLHHTEMENWKEVIPHREAVFLEGIELFKNYLVLEERYQGLSRIRIKSWEGDEDYYLDFDNETYTCGIGINLDFDSEVLRYSYGSLNTPYSVMEYNFKNKSHQVLKQQEVLGEFKPDDYRTERLWFPASDKTLIPVSLIYHKNHPPKEAPQNLLLYGYGAYGHTIEPGFSIARLSLLNRGFSFAIAHVRGGQYLGREWYEQGRMLQKKNSFGDFIAVAEGLIKKNYTRPSLLYAMGGSAGGLLVGAVINQAPELFNGVIAAVPFVDVVTTMLDESIPLTTGEFDEWGNPKNEEYYHYIKSYSPYDQVKPQDYPALLITSGLHDSQVQYWEPTKWCAKLRSMKTDRNPLYLYTNMDSGHSGASGRFSALKETAMEYAFLLKTAGLDH